MRILFFGTSEFAVPALVALAESRHEILAVVSQPDKPQGRGLRVSESPVKRVALERGIPLLQPIRVRADSFLQTAHDLAPDALVLAAFGQIIPQALLDLPSFGPINIHGSLLPAYRGAAPIQYAILNGETVTGVTTMWMDATLDTGDILLKREVPIDADDNTATLTAKLAVAGAELALETLDRLESCNCPRILQDDSLATYAPSIKPEDCEVRWEESAERCRNRIRAMSPRPGAFASFRGRRVKLWAAESRRTDDRLAALASTVIAVGKDSVEVACGAGVLVLREVQPENSRRMSAPEWARGARIAIGDSLRG